MAVKINLFCSTKYKGKIISPGIHDVTQKKGKEWISLGIAQEVKEPVIESPNKDEKVDELKELDIDLDLKE